MSVQVKCITIIFKTIEAAGNALLKDGEKTEEKEEGGGALGADDFLPVFILVVLRSQLPRLYSDCYYIQSFLNPIRLMSKKGYCLVNLQSAIEFLMNMDAESLNIDPDEYKRKLQEAMNE
jgi:hypothetical protein